MKFWIIVCSFCHVCNVFGTPILGGVDAEEQKYKYQVSLQEIDRNRKILQHFCGGTIISEFWILTAAHCVDNDRIKMDIKRLLVVAGITKLSEEGDKYFIKSFQIHKNWNKAKIAYDIAVLETTKRIKFSSAVKPIIRLATTDPDIKTNTVLVGWGFTSDYVSMDITPTPDALQVAHFETISLKECREQFNEAQYPGRLVIHTNICIAQPMGKGICNGDSGDGLTNDNGTLIGVISFGGQCSEGLPGVATSVATFLDWIKERTGIK